LSDSHTVHAGWGLLIHCQDRSANDAQP
jgi:hypothetical protein